MSSHGTPSPISPRRKPELKEGARPVVALAQDLHPAAMEALHAAADVRKAAELSAPALAGVCREADAIITRNTSVDRAVIVAAPRVCVIGRHGVGLDNIDLAAATAAGIPVVHTPAANTTSVAEHTIAMLLALAKRLPEVDQLVKSNRFGARGGFLALDVEGLTLGLIGLGRIGAAVARIASGALGMAVLAHDPYLNGVPPAGVRLVSDLDQMLAQSDFVSVHSPLTPETRKLVNAQRLARMKRGAYLINCARGPVVDEAALAAALREGRIAGAALDVFDPEPPAADSPLLQLPNVLLSPHTAALTDASLRRMGLTVVEEVLTVVRGERPRFLANPEVWPPDPEGRTQR